jgi:hypothetical protein
VGDVSDINPAHRLVNGLRRELRSSGFAQQSTEELLSLGVDAGQWRTAARRAARQLGRPVQTGQAEFSVWAALRDWPATPVERRHQQEQMRRAVEAASTPHEKERPPLHVVDPERH